MGDADIEAVIATQAALIAALDSGDITALESTTAQLSRLLTTMRGDGAAAPLRRDRIDHALRQTEAASTRVNFLADRTRQRRVRLAERCGNRLSATYTAAGRYMIT